MGDVSRKLRVRVSDNMDVNHAWSSAVTRRSWNTRSTSWAHSRVMASLDVHFIGVVHMMPCSAHTHTHNTPCSDDLALTPKHSS